MKSQPSILYRKVGELASLEGWSQYEDLDCYLKMTPAKVKTYQSNPYLENGLDDVAQVLGVMDGAVIGGQSPIAMPIIASGEKIVACGASRLWVNPKYRKTGIALELIEQVTKVPSGHVCVNAGLSFQARKVYAMMGYGVFPLSQFGYIRKSDSFVENHFRNFMKTCVAAFANAIFGVQRCVIQLLARIKTRGFLIETVSVDDDSMVEMFSKMIASDRHAFRADIDARWFKWVSSNDFNDVSKAAYRLYAIKKNGSQVGFFFTRLSSGGKEGRIIEWQMLDPFNKSEGWLMLRVAERLCRQGAHFVTLSVPAGNLATLFGKLHIRAFSPQVVVVASAEDSPIRLHKGYDGAANWRLRPSMGDAAFF